MRNVRAGYPIMFSLGFTEPQDCEKCAGGLPDDDQIVERLSCDS